MIQLLATSIASASASGAPQPEDLSKDPGLGPGLANPTQALDGAAAPALPLQQQTRFIAVTGPDREQTSATTTVVLAYSLFWLILFVLVYRTYRAQERLQTRMAELEQRLPKEPASR